MVDARKQRTLAQVAMVYVQQKRVEHTALRFDVIAVRLGTAIPDVSHYPAAFSPASPYFY
jgi:Holliday junction resolvase-like predicted endonuclease